MIDSTPPLVFAPRAHLGASPEGDWWLTSVESWSRRVVLRAHVLGYESVPGQPHIGGLLTWQVSADGSDLGWVSTLAGGTGAETRMEWVFGAREAISPGPSLKIRWSGPGTLQGELELP